MYDNQKEAVLNLYSQSMKIALSLRMDDIPYEIIAKNVIASAKRIFGATKYSSVV